MGRVASELYPRLLGAAWASLAEPVRRLHVPSACAERKGLFAVVRGGSAGARLCGWLMRLPPGGSGVPLELAIHATPHGDRWERSFADRTLVTLQRESEPGVLSERWGPIECRFRLEARQGALVYRQLGAWLRLGPLCVRLPRPIAPSVSGVACAAGERVHVDVAIDVPLFGPLIAYRGEVAVTRTEGAVA